MAGSGSRRVRRIDDRVVAIVAPDRSPPRRAAEASSPSALALSMRPAITRAIRSTTSMLDTGMSCSCENARTGNDGAARGFRVKRAANRGRFSMLKRLLFALLMLAAAPALAQPPQPAGAGAAAEPGAARRRRAGGGVAQGPGAARRPVRRRLPRAGARRADPGRGRSSSPPNMARCRASPGSTPPRRRPA